MTRASLFRSTCCIAAVFALGACVADSARYPSLARRSVERAEPAPVAAPAPVTDTAPSADVAKRVAELVDGAHAAQRDFAAKEPAAERGVASGKAELGSESWATASTALAELESEHAGAAQALAELDQMEVDQRVQADGAETPEIATIVSARNEVSQIVESQAAVIARLRDRVAS